MQVIKDRTTFSVLQDTSVAIGKFDGIHLGHQMLLSKVMEEKKNGLLTAVFTFDPSPTAFFAGKQIPELTTKEEKRKFFEEIGIDIVVEFPLNSQTAAISPESFICDILVNSLHAKKIVAGEDISFGDRGTGNKELLKKYETTCGYETVILEKITYKEREISSTYVREEVEKGNLSVANELLGTPYSFFGTVVKGNQIGRTIGMPTLNLVPPNGKLMPPNGVYFSRVSWQDNRNGTVIKKSCNGITNIGYKPTVSDEKIKGVETYLYDVTQDMYGKEITVELLRFQRTEVKFDTLEELKEQVQEDREKGRGYFKLNQ